MDDPLLDRDEFKVGVPEILRSSFTMDALTPEGSPELLTR